MPNPIGKHIKKSLNEHLSLLNHYFRISEYFEEIITSDIFGAIDLVEGYTDTLSSILSDEPIYVGCMDDYIITEIFSNDKIKFSVEDVNLDTNKLCYFSKNNSALISCVNVNDSLVYFFVFPISKKLEYDSKNTIDILKLFMKRFRVYYNIIQNRHDEKNLIDLNDNLIKNHITEIFDSEKKSVISKNYRWNAILNFVLHSLDTELINGSDDYDVLGQILTVEKGNKFLRLRSANPQKNMLFHRLAAESVMTGLVFEDKYSDHKHILLNPQKEHSDRYAAFFYEKELPQSELIIPIKHGGNVVAILNFEHFDVSFFTRHRIERIARYVNRIESIILNILTEEIIYRARDKEFRYILLRLFKKISMQYEHKVKNQISNIKTSVKTLQLHSDEKKKARQLELILKETSGLEVGSSTFLQGMEKFIDYGKLTPLGVINEIIDQLVIEAIKVDYGLDISVSLEDEDTSIFGSGLLTEHIYNVVNNSIEAWISVFSTDRTKMGKLVISGKIRNILDKRDRQTSSAIYQFTISDQAGGIPDDVFSNVLVDGFTTKRKTGGSGFGLPAAKDYVETLGGWFDLENRYPYGLNVNIGLPVFIDGYHDGLALRLNTHNEDGRNENIGR